MAKTKLTNYGVSEDRLTDKQRKFVCEYLIDYNATRAAKAAGYVATKATGSKLLKNPLIARLVGKRSKEIVDRLELKAEEVLRQLYYCVTRTADDFTDDTGKIITDVHRLNERAKATIDSIEQEVTVYDDGSERVKTKLRLVPKATAIDMAMKHKGLFAPDRLEVASKEKLQIDFDKLCGATNGELDEVEEKILDVEGKVVE